MSRYVDTDTLKVSITKYGALHISHKKLPIVKNEAKELIKDICFAIDAQSTVDVAPVVRCVDCKYLDESSAVGGWDGLCKCWNTHIPVYSGFCYRGERREVTE